MNPVDWTDPKCKISEYFTVKDATYLPSWKVFHQPSDEEKANILKSAQKMDQIREFLGQPINVNCWIRPYATNCTGFWSGKNYNLFVGGAPQSYHPKGLAVDFTVSRVTCDEVRSHLLDKLKEFQIRMEDRQGNWIHIDLGDVGVSGKRFFKP